MGVGELLVLLAQLTGQGNKPRKQPLLSPLARTAGLVTICFLTWILNCGR